MRRRDPLASALVGLGCALIIGAPVAAVAVSCTASPQGAASPSTAELVDRAPASAPAVVWADTQSPARADQEVSSPSRP